MPNTAAAKLKPEAGADPGVKSQKERNTSHVTPPPPHKPTSPDSSAVEGSEGSGSTELKFKTGTLVKPRGWLRGWLVMMTGAAVAGAGASGVTATAAAAAAAAAAVAAAAAAVASSSSSAACFAASFSATFFFCSAMASS